jgi:hypothetical protein
VDSGVVAAHDGVSITGLTLGERTCACAMRQAPSEKVTLTNNRILGTTLKNTDCILFEARDYRS